MLALNVAYCDAQQTAGSVLLVSINSEITVATTTMMNDAFGIAKARGVRLIIVRLNTPGGEVGAVKDIMDLFEASNVPVCAFVYPPAATAWSGGTYVLMASDIAAMASGTTIGSCQPVYPTGQPINYSKYMNAYTALMRHHARLHSRNETMAELFVTQNINVGPEEALKDHVIEVIADDVDVLLKKLEGLTLVQLRGEAGTLVWKLLPNQEAEGVEAVQKFTFNGVSEAEKVEYSPGLGVTVQKILFNPLVSSLLLILGLFILLTGLHTPGYGTEIVGVLCLLLALVGLGAIGITMSAVVLFAAGALLIIAELKTHIGVLAISGAVCLIIGSLLLFPSPQWLLYYKVSEQIRNVLLGVSLFVAFFFTFLVYKVAKARRLKIVTGAEALIGAFGVAVSELKPKGEVRVRGEFWQAKTEEELIRKGEKVEIMGREGMFLIVRPVKEKV
ncbi:MAG: nodulation protein NfeD [Candidatus Bathyarchaeia archaeon]